MRGATSAAAASRRPWRCGGRAAPPSLLPPDRAEAEADFLEVRRPGVDACPTLLLHTAHGADRLGGPIASADALTHALDQHVAATTAA
ncbi:hypothetical protein OOK36_33990 [Streptomyces sp. NBC_00365]|uniref:hypothetical protein n=1 Tax=Streptomyces sp. NBC_00365 TaxID=2975726 RepID=UPI00224D2B64|nr:hypothetical protein [Streptomyces sp. NBC_00365]MCX5093812.1 hypothetical protein [Streptomyces sp. NBC_00365]